MSENWDASGWLAADDEDDIRRRQIEEMMRTDRPRYFRDEAVQQEYRDIVDRQEARQQGRERNTSAPGAEFGIPVERSAVGQQRRDRVTALTGTQSEVQAGREPAVDQNPLSYDAAHLVYLTAVNGKRIDDPRVLSDVTPDNDWTPGAQYAGRKRTPELNGIREDDGRDYYRPQGHHEMPREYYRKWNLQPETAEVFKDSNTGKNRLTYKEAPDGPRIGNISNKFHQVYNDAVGELALDFFSKNGIRPDGSNMTRGQALELLKQIRESDDPRIRDFNYNIRRIQRLFRLRSGSDD